MNQAMRWAAHEPIDLSQQVVLIILLACFAIIGWKRGVNRELLSLVGILVGIWVVERIGLRLAWWVNRFYRLAVFALTGGLSAEDPTSAWKSAGELPDLVRGQDAAMMLVFAAFTVIVLIAVYIGQRRIAAPKGRVVQCLGAVAGAINGFLVASVVLPKIIKDTTMTIRVPTKEVTEALLDASNIGLLIVFFVVTLIALGLYNASGKSK